MSRSALVQFGIFGGDSEVNVDGKGGSSHGHLSSLIGMTHNIPGAGHDRPCILKKMITRRFWKRTRKPHGNDDGPHPISFLPPEIISKIFLHCLPTLRIPVSRRYGPLLPAQICRLWREIALQTRELWTDIHPYARNMSVVDMMDLWTSRAGTLPLNFWLESCFPERGRLLVEAAMRHHGRWGLLQLSIPSASYASLHTLADASFPLSHTLKLDIPRENQCGSLPETPHIEYSNKLIIRDAPQLRKLELYASKHYFDFPVCLLEIPWGQLEGALAVTIKNDTWAESLSRLILCTNLTELRVFCEDFQDEDTPIPVPVEITGHTTMPFLHCLALHDSPYHDSPYLAQLLDHFTLPVLDSLTMSLSGSRDDFRRLQSLFSRAACPILELTLTLWISSFLGPSWRWPRRL
ncbi:hypothetical protein K438DRAFT_307793 [Mycena galopus ATCC 62051]|nr:hypothetical protein K438DRAFT_307793 [Mycena galopus ATCC 62051]